MNPSRVRWGVTLILIGLVFLANNLGYLSWWIWADLLRLWPILLIVIGLEILVKQTKLQLVGYLSTLVIILAFVWVIWGDGGFGREGWGAIRPSRDEVVLKRDGQTSAAVKLTFSDGRLYFNDAGDENIVRINSQGIDPELDANCSGTNCDVEITPQNNRGDRGESHWRCYLLRDIPISYDLKLAKADLRFFGEDLNISSVRIDAEDADLLLRLGKAQAETAVDVTGRSAELEIILPDSSGIRIDGTYPSQLEIDSLRLVDRGGYLVNPYFDAAAVKYRIKASLTNGKVRLGYY